MQNNEKDNDEKFNETKTTLVPPVPENIEDEEEEIIPQNLEEENEAKQLDVVNIVIILFVVFFAFVLLINLGGNKIKKNKKDAESSLGQANSRYSPSFTLSDTGKSTLEAEGIKDIAEQFDSAGIDDKEPLTDEDIENSLNAKGINGGFLDGNSQVQGTAPVVKTTTVVTSSRPDTKNSKSPRNIQGIAGLSTSTTTSNTEIISSVLNGTYQSPQSLSRDEYVNSKLEQYNSLYSNSSPYQQNYSNYQNNQNGNTALYSDTIGKNDFYNTQGTTAGNGSFLPINTLWDGTIIKGALETAINTDNPGLVIARVTENVYSSLDHSFLLIPEGTILHGSYNSSVSYGQNTIQVAWTLLIRPDGYRLELGNMNGVNSQGASGYSAYVTNHPFETLKALGLVAMFSVLQAEVTSTVNTQNNKYLETAIGDVYTEVSKIGNKILNKALDIQPTLKIKVGQEIKLITNTPLVLPPCEVYTPNKPYVRTR